MASLLVSAQVALGFLFKAQPSGLSSSGAGVPSLTPFPNGSLCARTSVRLAYATELRTTEEAVTSYLSGLRTADNVTAALDVTAAPAPPPPERMAGREPGREPGRKPCDGYIAVT